MTGILAKACGNSWVTAAGNAVTDLFPLANHRLTRPRRLAVWEFFFELDMLVRILPLIRAGLGMLLRLCRK